MLILRSFTDGFNILNGSIHSHMAILVVLLIQAGRIATKAHVDLHEDKSFWQLNWSTEFVNFDENEEISRV